MKPDRSRPFRRHKKFVKSRDVFLQLRLTTTYLAFAIIAWFSFVSSGHLFSTSAANQS
jgi:hypothetical protein